MYSWEHNKLCALRIMSLPQHKAVFGLLTQRLVDRSERKGSAAPVIVQYYSPVTTCGDIWWVEFTPGHNSGVWLKQLQQQHATCWELFIVPEICGITGLIHTNWQTLSACSVNTVNLIMLALKSGRTNKKVWSYKTLFVSFVLCTLLVLTRKQNGKWGNWIYLWHIFGSFSE